jgi:hypothetical protein
MATHENARQDRACLGRLLKLHRDRHWLVDRHDYLIAVRAAGGSLRVLLVLGGNCCFVGAIVDRGDLADIVRELQGAIGAEGRPVASPHADLSTVLAHWVRRRDAAADRILIDFSRDDWEASIAAAAAVLERHLPIATRDRE